MKLLEGRAAVVTGGAQGIGAAIVRALVSHGASVTVADLDGDRAKQLADEVPGDVLPTVCDVSSAQDVEGALELTCAEFGSVGVMINNAGITRDASMRNMTEQQFDEVISIHLKGCWNGTRLAANHMREQRFGSIVNISSLSGKVGMAGQTNYSAAKAGIVGLTKAAAKELARHNVRVNAVQPGLIDTAMTRALSQEVWDQKMVEIPLGRAGHPDEIAQVAVFYASDMSSYMTGTVAEVTGGRFM